MTSPALKRKLQDYLRTATDLEHVTAVKISVEQYPHRSARKHALALRLFDQNVKKCQLLKLLLYIS